MNIKIGKEQVKFLFDREISRTLCGSRLYGTHTEESDYDYLVFYEPLDANLEAIYTIQHQFQYDERNRQYNFTTINQYWRNLLSGNATINADIALLPNELVQGTDEKKLNTCRTYNIIKAYLGFAKRDIRDFKKGKGKNKLFHIQRGLLFADCLMRNQVPILEDIQAIKVGLFTIEELEKNEAEYRKECNNLFEKNELTMYPRKPPTRPEYSGVHKDLLELQINSMNIKEFRYG